MSDPAPSATPAPARTCHACQATLSAHAKFCHRCGTPVAGGPGATMGVQRSERNAWIVAGTIVALLLAMIVYRMMVDGPGGPRAPDMANAGNQGPGAAAGASSDAGGGLPTAQAPDISALSPAERFTRLYNRVMQAAANDDTTTVVNFTPMALGAYRQLETISNDERYHAAVLNAQVGNMAAALALADTMLATTPDYLLGYVIRGEVARLQNDADRLRQARAAFDAAYAREIAARRVEYVDHKNVLDDFRSR